MPETPTDNDNRFLFIHVMKTGGTSFSEIIRRNFPREERYPDAYLPPDAIMAEQMEAYLHVPRILEAVKSARQPLRILSGHVPYAIRDHLPGQYRAITLLRHPVSRTVSYLKHCHKYHVEHRGMPLEDIYADRWFFESFIHNYQTKLFSMNTDEVLSENRLGDASPPLPPRSAFIAGEPTPEAAKPLEERGSARLALELFSCSTAVIEANESRLRAATSNLSQIDLVGTTGHYDRFLQKLEEQFGWSTTPLPHHNAGADLDVSPEFARRIERDNEYDMALYEHALTLLP